ncbi:MAG TPA: hypothetical protein VGJ16_12840, partial [Pirellulales bacterium]
AAQKFRDAEQHATQANDALNTAARLYNECDEALVFLENQGGGGGGGGGGNPDYNPWQSDYWFSI